MLVAVSYTHIDVYKRQALYEYIPGCDFGDADEQSSVPIVDAVAEEIKEEANAAPIRYNLCGYLRLVPIRL